MNKFDDLISYMKCAVDDELNKRGNATNRSGTAIDRIIFRAVGKQARPAADAPNEPPHMRVHLKNLGIDIGKPLSGNSKRTCYSIRSEMIAPETWWIKVFRKYALNANEK